MPEKETGQDQKTEVDSDGNLEKEILGTIDSRFSTEEKSTVQEEDKDESAEGEITKTETDAETKAVDSKKSQETGGPPGKAASGVEVEEIGEELLAQALAAGISLSDALAFPTEESLARVIVAIRNSKTEGAGKEVQDESFEAPEIDPDEIDPKLSKWIKNLTAEVKKQRGELEAYKEHVEQTRQVAAVANLKEIEGWFDKQVEKLGEDFTDALGAGGYSSLDRGSPQYAKREELANFMAVILTGYHAQGLQPPSREDVFNIAASVVLADTFKESEEKELKKGLQKQSTQHIQRAAGGKRATSTVSPSEEAAQLLAERFNISAK